MSENQQTSEADVVDIEKRIVDILSDISKLPSEEEVFAAPGILKEIKDCTDDTAAASLSQRLMTAYSKHKDNEIPLTGTDYHKVLSLVYKKDIMIDGLVDDLDIDKKMLLANIDLVVNGLADYANEHEKQHYDKANAIGWQARCSLEFYRDTQQRPHCKPGTVVAPVTELTADKLKADTQSLTSEIDSPSKGDEAIIEALS